MERAFMIEPSLFISAHRRARPHLQMEYPPPWLAIHSSGDGYEDLCQVVRIDLSGAEPLRMCYVCYVGA